MEKHGRGRMVISLRGRVGDLIVKINHVACLASVLSSKQYPNHKQSLYPSQILSDSSAFLNNVCRNILFIFARR